MVDSEEEARVTGRVLGGVREASESSKDCCMGWIFRRNCLFLFVTWRDNGLFSTSPLSSCSTPLFSMSPSVTFSISSSLFFHMKSFMGLVGGPRLALMRREGTSWSVISALIVVTFNHCQSGALLVLYGIIELSQLR